jgi:ElaB/YqjD/DUF883 family membrane-anchored ribosome-binding protein
MATQNGELGGVTGGGGASLRTDYEALKSDLSAMREDIEQILGGIKREGKDRASKVMDRAGTTIKERPLIALLVVFFVGLVLGRMVFRS